MTAKEAVERLKLGDKVKVTTAGGTLYETEIVSGVGTGMLKTKQGWNINDSWNDTKEVELIGSSNMGDSTMVYQVVVEGVKLATASTPEKKSIVLGPITVEASDDKEAILIVASEQSDVIKESAFDKYGVSVKTF